MKKGIQTELKLLIVVQLIALPWESFSPSSDMKAFIKSFHMRYIGQVDWPANQSTEYKLARKQEPTVEKKKYRLLLIAVIHYS